MADHEPQLSPPTRILLQEALRFSNLACDNLDEVKELLIIMSQVGPELRGPLDQSAVGDAFPPLLIREVCTIGSMNPSSVTGVLLILLRMFPCHQIEGALQSATVFLLRAIVLQRGISGYLLSSMNVPLADLAEFLPYAKGVFGFHCRSCC